MGRAYIPTALLEQSAVEAGDACFQTSMAPASLLVQSGKPGIDTGLPTTRRSPDSNEADEPVSPQRLEWAKITSDAFSRRLDKVSTHVSHLSRRYVRLEFDEKHVSQVLTVFTLIVAWFVLATALNMLNRCLFGRRYYNFKLPLFASGLQQLFQFTIAASFLWRFPTLQPATRPPEIHSFMYRIVPTALMGALDVGLSNASLMFITVTCYTVCKSSTPIFVLLSAVALKLETFSWRLLAIISFITFGVFLSVWSGTEFELTGISLVLAAAAISGLRWTFTQLLLLKENLIINPVVAIFYFSPVMGLFLLILSRLFELPGASSADYLPAFGFAETYSEAFGIVFAIFLSAILAFALVLSEYQLLMLTSVTTFCVVGILKEIFTIALSTLFFRDQFGWINTVGVIVSFVGIMLYHWHKVGKKSHAQS